MQPLSAWSIPWVQSLESRTHLSAAPLNVSSVSTPQGLQLQVLGTRRDHIFLHQTPDGIRVRTADGFLQTCTDACSSILIRAGSGPSRIIVRPSVTLDTIIYGGSGNDTLQGGSGNDQIYAGPKNNLIRGGAGDDTIVALQAASAVIRGGSGQNSFWLSSSPNQCITDLTPAAATDGSVHRVDGFFDSSASAPTTTTVSAGVAAAPALPEPALTDSHMHYTSFAGLPLFSAAGPSPNDVKQGDVGDCYFLATLSAIAKTDPHSIRQSVVALGDGTYAVQFVNGSSKVFVRVDGQLPAWSWGGPAYAGLGSQKSLWVAIMEKAYACFRTSNFSYASLNGGWMSEVYQALGDSWVNTFKADSATSLLTLIQQELSSGMAVTYATNQAPPDSPLISGHAYMVDTVIVDANNQPVALRLRNPWGYDGAGNDGNNDGYVTITAPQALQAFLGLVAALV